MLDQSIFKAYDIRGIVDQSLTDETVVLIGQALGSLAKDENQKIFVWDMMAGSQVQKSANY